jgi:hypothetical protein
MLHRPINRLLLPFGDNFHIFSPVHLGARVVAGQYLFQQCPELLREAVSVKDVFQVRLHNLARLVVVCGAAVDNENVLIPGKHCVVKERIRRFNRIVGPWQVRPGTPVHTRIHDGVMLAVVRPHAVIPIAFVLVASAFALFMRFMNVADPRILISLAQGIVASGGQVYFVIH